MEWRNGGKLMTKYNQISRENLGICRENTVCIISPGSALAWPQ